MRKKLTKFWLAGILFHLCCAFTAFANPICDLKIGGLLPLSGELAAEGVEIRDGMVLAQEELSQPQIRLVFDDTEFSNRKAASAAQRMLDMEKPDVVVPLWDTAESVAPIAERRGVITFAIRWNPHITENKPLTFTFESTYKSWTDSLIKLAEHRGAKRIAVITEIAAGWELSRDYLLKRAKERGLEVVSSIDLDGSTADVRTPVTRTLSAKPEMLALLTFRSMTTSILRAVKEQKSAVMTTGYYSLLESADFPLADGQPFVDQVGYFPEFSDRFEKRFNYRAKSRGPHGYELVKILWDASKASCHDGKIRIEDMVRYLNAMKDRPSVLGPLTTNQTRNIEHPPHWKIIKDGVLTEYKTVRK